MSIATLYEQAAKDAERLRNDPAEQAEIRAVNTELDEICAGYSTGAWEDYDNGLRQ